MPAHTGTAIAKIIPTNLKRLKQLYPWTSFADSLVCMFYLEALAMW